MTVLTNRVKSTIMSYNKGEGLSKQNRRLYLSVPNVNNINGEVYINGKRRLSDNNSGSSQPMTCTLDKNIKKERTKSFMSVFSLNGSFANEKNEYSLLQNLNLDFKPKTWNSTYLPTNNDHSDFSLSNHSSRNEEKPINGNPLCMTQAHSVSRGPTDPDGSAGAPLAPKNLETSELIQSSRSSKARQKKFHRHFKQVDIEEKLLNYYSCALVGDILLQGHLYITENFFAFYSNVFGYVTKLLIPTVDVLKISKEKTAKIIPNAVGISTEDEKHVFGSLLSRDSTYKFMVQVWKAANSNSTAIINTPPVIKTELPTDEDSSVSSGNEDPSYISNLTSPASSDNLPSLLPNTKRKSIVMASKELHNSRLYWNSFQVKSVLAVSLAIIVMLLGFAGFLFYRIAIIQNHFNDLSIPSRGSDVYEDIVKWQSTIHSKSANKISEFLTSNLNQIVKVRLSLEALSMLILPGGDEIEKSPSHSKWESTNVRDSNKESEADDELHSSAELDQFT